MTEASEDQRAYEEITRTSAALRRECSRCAAELKPEWQFCAHCDTRLATQCPGCGVPLPPASSEATHCGQCGLVFVAMRPVDDA